jgi:hypothetical protein
MDSNLYIDVANPEVVPGGKVTGKVLWALDKPPGELLLSLGWWTDGRGTKDAKIVEETTWQTSAVAGEEGFSFSIPESPYSFNGQLVSVKWCLELSARESRDKFMLEIIVSPWGVPVELPKVEDESSRKSISFLRNR